MWSLCTHAFVRRYKWDVLASVAASFGRERGSLNHAPAAASRLPGLLTSLCPSLPGRLYRLIWAWLESWLKKKKKKRQILLLISFLKRVTVLNLEARGYFKSVLIFRLAPPPMNGLPRWCHSGQWSSVCLLAPHWTGRQESLLPPYLSQLPSSLKHYLFSYTQINLLTCSSL